jgi:hypothetical protein
MLATLRLLTPAAALVGLVGLVPLLALVEGQRRASVVRRLLGLRAPEAVSQAQPVALIVAVAVFVAIAAAQPALVSERAVHARTDAQMLFVVDTSRSMLAGSAPGGETRLARARRQATAVRERLTDVPAGVAGFDDRVLPFLFPTADRTVFDAVLARTIRADDPPPRETSSVSSTFDALGNLGAGNFFTDSARKRVAIVFTDGETRTFDPRNVAQSISTVRPAVQLVLVHVWRSGESVYDGDRAETAYHPDPSSGAALASLASATHALRPADDVGAVTAAVRRLVGRGPVVATGRERRVRPLAPLPALLALIPLGLLLRRSSRR